jgi:arylsulfatase A-like enzyme
MSINQNKKPNIVFFFADDQRFDTIAALGNKEIYTPNLDKLVHQGVSFTHAHIPGGTVGAVCMPSRAMVNISRELFHLEDSGRAISEKHVLLGELLQKSGYETCGIGKWHNGIASYARSFTCGGEIFFGGMWDHWNVPANSFDPTGKYDRAVPYATDFYHSKKLQVMVTDHVSSGKHSTDLFCETAISWLSDYKKEKPFYLYTAFMAPHDPRTMPQKFKDMYDPKNITLPENFMGQHPFEFGVHEERDELLAPYPRTEDETRRHIAEYYGMISHLDDAIGRIMDKLKAIGEYDNTIFVFAGDNGLALGQHGLMGKQNVYEHSLRVPLIFAGPGIAQDVQSTDSCYLMDIFPTLCDLISAEKPREIEGISLIDSLHQVEHTPKREILYFAFADLVRAVQKDSFKLIAYAGDWGRRFQLFDEESDPWELHDLSNEPSCMATFKEMQALLLKQRDINDDNYLDVSKKFWNAYNSAK